MDYSKYTKSYGSFDPQSPQEHRDLWLSYGKEVINNIVGFENALLEAKQCEDGLNYYLMITFEDEVSLDKFLDMTEGMYDDGQGPLGSLDLILNGDESGNPENEVEPEFYWAQKTLW